MKGICKKCQKPYLKSGKSQQYCKPCAYLRRREREREYDRKRRTKIEYKDWFNEWRNQPIQKQKKREADKAYYLKNKEKLLKYQKEKRALDKEKIKFRNHAVKVLKKVLFDERGEKCERCGSTNNLVVHHKKYTNNLNDLEILCTRCHALTHNR